MTTDKRFYTIITTREQANKAGRYLKFYSRNIRRAEKGNTVEFHLVADEATMKRIAKEVRF